MPEPLIPVVSSRRKSGLGILLSLLAFVLSLALARAGVLTPYSLKTYDLLVRWLPLPPASPEIVLITVGQPDLDFFKERGVSWPWPRQLYAPLLDFCRRGGARAVLLDILFTEPSVYGSEDDLQLARALREHGRAGMALFLTREPREADIPPESFVFRSSLVLEGAPPPQLPQYQGVTAPVPVLLEAAAFLGNVECRPDADGIYRRIPVLGVLRGNFLPTLAFAAFCRLVRPGVWQFQPGVLAQGSYRVPVDEGGRVFLKFRDPGQRYRRLSAANVIQSEYRLQHGETPIYSPAEVAGKWVLVGLTAPGLLDLRPTPLLPVFPGVELQATLLDNLLTGDFLREAPVWCSWLLGLVFAWAVTFLVLFTSRLGLLLTVAGALAFALVGLSLLAFRLHWWLDPVGPALAFGLAFGLAAAYSYATEGRQKQAIRRLFAQYMSEKVISHLLEHPELLKLGGERRRVTLFFSDLAGFTTLSERLSPEEVVALLNDYLSRMTDIILAEEGTVDKFEGDAIMAFWGAPLPQEDQALRACRAALAQQAALAEVNRAFRARGLPPLSMRIGVHTGEAVVGNLGSQKRFDYTVIGDTVNLASRLEGLNKFYGTPILVSETTRAECHEDILFREVDRVAVKGREAPVTVYQPLGLRQEASPELLSLAGEFSQALALYREKRFREAAGRFAALLARFPGDGPAQVFLRRCQHLAAACPRDWDGVFHPEHK